MEYDEIEQFNFENDFFYTSFLALILLFYSHKNRIHQTHPFLVNSYVLFSEFVSSLCRPFLLNGTMCI